MVVTNSPLKYCSRTTKAKGGWTEYNSNEASLKLNISPALRKSLFAGRQQRQRQREATRRFD